GKRLKQIEVSCGSKASAAVMWREEAERYGATPGSPVPGTKPGEAGDKKKTADGNLTTNPWSKNFRGDEAARAAKIASIIKTGSKLAENLAKAAGTTTGRPL